MGLQNAKNFVTANAVDAILAVPTNRRRPPIDYLKKEDFGRVPVRKESKRLPRRRAEKRLVPNAKSKTS